METETQLRARILRQLSDERIPINVAPEARDALREYLIRDRSGTGEGYSEFILRAVEIRRKEDRIRRFKIVPKVIRIRFRNSVDRLRCLLKCCTLVFCGRQYDARVFQCGRCLRMEYRQ